MELAVAMRHTHTIATAKCRDAQRVRNAGRKRQPPVLGVVDAYLLKMVQGEDGASACLETSESRSPQGGQNLLPPPPRVDDEGSQYLLFWQA